MSQASITSIPYVLLLHGSRCWVYLDWRDSDLKTDRAYRADASHELDMLAMLSELAQEAEGEENKEE